MHVRLPVGKGCDASLLVRPYPTTTIERDFFRGLNFTKSLSPSAATQFWRSVVMPAIERAVALVVLHARPSPLKTHLSLLRAGAAHRRFAILSLDVLLDEGGDIHVVDVNTNGNLQGDYSLFNTQPDINALLPILGANGFPKRVVYGADADALVERCCAHCGKEARQAAFETLDEEVHAFGSMWYRIFPALLTNAHEELAKRLPAGLLTEADGALHSFLRCRRSLVQ